MKLSINVPDFRKAQEAVKLAEMFNRDYPDRQGRREGVGYTNVIGKFYVYRSRGGHIFVHES